MALARNQRQVGGPNSATDTITGVTIGTASADRWLALSFTAGSLSTGTVTIGGVTATKAVNTSIGATLGWAWALVPTGTTANCVINSSGGWSLHGLWAITGASSISKVDDDFNISLSSSSFSINVGAGGVALGTAIEGAGGGATINWSTGLTDETDYNVSGVFGMGGSATTATTTSLSCSFTGATSPVSWAISFEPVATAKAIPLFARPLRIVNRRR